mmetsp:Transcript_5681/g.13350  ORF Transcript_5681/g.13350 Transcript_5681/m.13350 type:complete len:200 (-) Transcript_5681:81-680(-)|eukprot:CAMPEP_0206433968 /NCGR_PEP_ID=MMETSP0324_2-20121206/8841_1 /ASSEMBLY_ACC=CAM_ASM_000836 /TAXON_ID=2866 /ORGANISM="Crypthecodinium cohnii, Strain Seligo" /LENGTH=199 /DNA_ID=CAMNT_0053900319 /DNA_START=78 /DNA_END=677 /DNA_ORIENTATION=+
MPVAVRHAPGGASSLVLGADQPCAPATTTSSNRFANGANQNAGNVLTDRSSTRVLQGPGGSSTICLGADIDTRPLPTRNAVAQPQPQPQVQSGATKPAAVRAAGVAQRNGMNAFACGANQNAGNSIGDRPSTRVHAGPGGTSTICLGAEDEPPTAKGSAQSSNRWANGANQNAGNVLTDRPSTRIHYGPGGATSICLGA